MKADSYVQSRGLIRWVGLSLIRSGSGIDGLRASGDSGSDAYD